MSDSQNNPRVLSCVLCQQRKVRCNRTFPCANCLRSKAQCVPAALLPRRRKRRFPERELLDRLHQYENLLRQNDIEFHPLHGEPPREGEDNKRLGTADSDNTDRRSPSSLSRVKSSEDPYEAKNLWHAMNQTSPDSDEGGNSPAAAVTRDVVRKAWDQEIGTSDPLFGDEKIPDDLSSLHPESSQIFRLWQIYLDNVDPLLKVTHTPTLQGRIIEATTNLKAVSPGLEALMFGIYCVAILSLMSDDCEAMLGTSRDELLARHQRSCRQALIRCGFLRTDDCDCLTALYFYLISMRPVIGDPRAISSMLGIAIRAAQRMGLHSESTCARYPPLEAEIRRRLWWALVLFDTRVAEMADSRTTMLTPLWDCKIPMNVNDFDLRPEMKDAPRIQGQLSEALFVVVRCEIGDFMRNSSCHLDFTCPPLKAIAKEVHRSSAHDAGELDTLERMIENRYLRFCNRENPLHFVTMWMTRGFIAKGRLFDYYSKYSAGPDAKSHRDTAMAHALAMLACDTRLLSSAYATRYSWMIHFYFPFPAYIHILQDLSRRPLSEQMEQCWVVMSENFEARMNLLRRMSPRIRLGALTGIVLQIWEATESALRQTGHTTAPPRIVSMMRDLVSQNSANPDIEKPSSSGSGYTASWSNQMNDDFYTQLPTMDEDSGYTRPEMWMPFDLPMQISGNNSFNPSDWLLMNWGM